jgi:hypothetical protein
MSIINIGGSLFPPNGDVGLTDLDNVDAGLLCCYYGVIKNSLATGGAGVAYIEDSDSISGEQIAISLPENVMDRTVIKGVLYDSTDNGVVDRTILAVDANKLCIWAIRKV